MVSGAREPVHSQRYSEALGWAAQLHRVQRRKGKPIPYISHLISVSALVWEDGGTENQAIAALLHDAIEDAGVSHGQIQERFGTEVADIVQACTDTAGPVSASGEKEPWLERKRRTIEALAGKPAAAWLVTAADKAHNARDMVLDAAADRSSWNRFRAGLEGSALTDRYKSEKSCAAVGLRSWGGQGAVRDWGCETKPDPR